MRLSEPLLRESIAAHRASAEPGTRAEIDNIWFEERVNDRRQGVFEGTLGGVTGWDELRRRHVDYHRTFVQVGAGLVPHTFEPDLVVRDLSQIDEMQKVVRIESIARPLAKAGLDFERLREAHAGDDADLVEHFLRNWNEMRDARPAFATPKSAVAADLARDDWPERLRDRLGLAHYDAAAGPEPIALVEYRVGEIVVEAQAAGAGCAVTAPTLLDSSPWPWFFPALSELDCGRAMALYEIDSDDDLVVELLHTRLIYRRDHVARLGWIGRSPERLALSRLRNHHLTALRLASGREDFGEEMPDHGAGGA